MNRLVPARATEGEDMLHVHAAFPMPAPSGRWVRGSFVMTLDGVVVGPDGRSGSLSNAVDRAAFPLLRDSADLILVGAGTARTERYNPSRKPMAIVTQSGQVPEDLPVLAQRTPGSAPLFVITTTTSNIPPHVSSAAEVIRAGTTEVDLAVALDRLVERGLRHIHCEGGPRLLSSLLAANRLDELVLTVVPELVGGNDGAHLLTTPGLPRAPMEFTQVIEADGTILLHATLRQ